MAEAPAAKRLRAEEPDAAAPAAPPAAEAGGAPVPAADGAAGAKGSSPFFPAGGPEAPAAGEANPLDEHDDFAELLDGAALGLFGSEDVAPPEPPDEVARRKFAERVTRDKQAALDAELPELLTVLRNDAPSWAPVRRWRSAALLVACVAKSSRICRASFVAEGLPVLGSVLQEGVNALETGGAAERQEAGMWTLACLACLRALPLGRATLWEHRHSVGKPFDRLHRWCGREKSALAAELRAPTVALCRRWRRQPQPAGQAAPELKAIRNKVVEMISQGLMGISGGNSPASPAPRCLASPAGSLPPNLVSVEVEAALFGHHGGASEQYRQHARMLRRNLALPANAKLRDRVLSGDLPAEELVKMDSAHLAPDALQEARRQAERKAMRELVIEDTIPRLPSKGEGSPKRDAFHYYTAPPLMVKSPQRTGSGNLEEAQPAETPAPVLEPPPTPFRDLPGAHAPEDAYPQMTPDVMATPAPDEDDEEHEALVQYLSKPVRS